MMPHPLAHWAAVKVSINPCMSPRRAMPEDEPDPQERFKRQLEDRYERESAAALWRLRHAGHPAVPGDPPPAPSAAGAVPRGRAARCRGPPGGA